jgi:hypothetical protein
LPVAYCQLLIVCRILAHCKLPIVNSKLPTANFSFPLFGTFLFPALSKQLQLKIMMEERIWLLVSLQLSGEATTEELEELKTLLQQYPGVSLKVEMIRNIWLNKTKEIPGTVKTNFDKHLQRLSNHLSEPALKFENAVSEEAPIEFERPVKNYRWLWGAAAVAASVMAFFLL